MSLKLYEAWLIDEGGWATTKTQKHKTLLLSLRLLLTV